MLAVLRLLYGHDVRIVVQLVEVDDISDLKADFDLHIHSASKTGIRNLCDDLSID